MKAASLISTGVLFLLFGALAPSYAEQEQHGQEAKPEKQEQQAKPAKQQQAKGQPERQQKQEAKGQQEQQQKQQQQAKGQPERQQKQQQQAKGQQERQQKQQQQQAKGQQEQQQKQEAKGQQERQQKQQQQQAKRPSQPRQRVQQTQRREVWQQHRAHNWKSEHRDWQQRGGYNGYRIPEDRYREHFGQDHWFRIHSYPMELYGGYPRFQYGGFWFGVMDPWPEYWADDWYDNDDVYIVYADGGYYMYNRQYPGDRIAIQVYIR
ncbi:MAG: hypothetical protein WB007_12800 [Candidatus Acidiferrales bacterium]